MNGQMDRRARVGARGPVSGLHLGANGVFFTNGRFKSLSLLGIV